MNNEKSIIDLAREASQAPEQSAPAQKKAKGKASSIDSALDSLLGKVQNKKGWLPVNLPSNGFAEYPATVEIRAFDFEDEKILRSIQTLADGPKVILNLLKRCVRGTNPEDLVLADKNFLLFKLRELSYGEEYPIGLVCNSCQEPNEVIVDLPSLGVSEATESLQKQLTLPDSEAEAVIRPAITKDEKYLDSNTKILDNLWRFVVSIGGYKDRMVIQEFIKKTTGKDISVIRETLQEESFGLQTKVNFECRFCGHSEHMELPLNEDFFTVSCQKE